MKVYVYPADKTGCGYYRLIWPAMKLREAGHDVVIIPPEHTQRVTGQTNGRGELTSASAPKDADVMVFQRVSSKMMLQAIDIYRQNGIAVVIDWDDDASAISQGNPAWLALHPQSTGNTAEYDWNTAAKICQKATYVTVSTDALLRRYAPHGRGMVLRNMIPGPALEINQPKTAGSVGWGGNIVTHPDDADVVGTSMMRLQRQGYKFTVIGPGRGVQKAFRTDDEPIVTGPVPLGAWLHHLAQLEVGIAPLADTRFNGAKSWLKMLEYAAVGTACVGSPRVEYMRLHNMGVGLLASSPSDWFRLCKRLLDNEVYRSEIVARSRAAVAGLTLEANAWRWMEAWSNALVVQRGLTGAQTGR